MRVAIACDHAGRNLLETARAVLEQLGHTVVDLAPPEGARVDYPIYALKAARALVAGEVERAVLICGTGIGMSIAANKVRGIRAAVAHDAYTAEKCRAHNDANILCLGERTTGIGVAEECVRIFLDTPFEGGRHVPRIEEITAAEDAK